MAQENKQTLEKQVLELTGQLEANSTDNKATAHILLQRAQVYEFLDEISKATEDVQTALKRDPQVKAEAAELLSRFSTHKESQQPSTSAATTEEDPRVASFQKHLANLEKSEDVSSIRHFVSSSDFVLVLTACGTPDTPPRIKSLAFMILTRLFNPQGDIKSYPMTYIIEQCAACFSHCMDQGKNETKLLAYRTLTALFQTSMTVGSAILCQEGTVEEMMDVVEFETVPVQLAIAEVLTIASSDKTCRKQIMKYAVDWLVKMAGQSKTEPQLKAAAGTALTKLRAQADLPTDDDASATTASSVTEATPTLEDAMRKMNLTNDTLIDSLKDIIKSKSSDASLVLNAVEGLAYACLKPDVKASLGDDEEFLKCLSTLTISTARQDTASSNPLLFGIGTILVNLTMYRPVMDDHQKQMKKLRDLANAKQRQAAGAPAQQQEEKDDPREDDKAVEERIKRAVQQGAAMALMVLSKNSSVNIRAVAAQTYLNLVTPQATRGQLLQQGIVKGLLPLSRDTNSGILASQALAKLAITTDPRIAFVGDTILDLVRPFLALCKDTAQLRQFEGLMALTNLASVDDRVRQLIEHADGMSVFENLQLSNNDMVQRAATEMVCNMTFCDPVFERYSDPSKSQNRIRLLMILSDHEDPATRRAASGALAILANSPGTCEMILKVDKCYERMVRWLSLEETVDVQHRGIEVLRCLVEHKGKPVVDEFVKLDADKMLMALVKQCQVQQVRSAAMEVLKMFVQNGVQLKA
ncbi:armadillo-type protein [Mucor lusitanicus]|uniref:Armadillo-type protein n=1 Tax=Mucor circinelloides f. lusitanicus TaxID=29924 RepID=A0A8H4BU64_MUCCL|nr:armadillo-type protein [Mucor lusitanicus]